MRLLRPITLLVAGFFCLAGLMAGDAAAQPAGKRIALVVGNGGYRTVERLTNPANDARLIARTLQAAGFTLVGGGVQLDLDKARFDRAVQDFGRAVQGADVALFYYSGHGMQVRGTNWLVPVDANPTGDKDLDFQMVDAGLVLHQMEGAGTKLNLVILDACRNNPFAVRGVRGSQSGLAEMHAPEGTLISYATQPGNVASDGSSGDSPYTKALADAIRRPGLDMFQVFNQVGLAVKQETGGNQQPWLASSPLSGNFYFFNGPVTIAPGPAADPETVFWQSISAGSNPADYQSYLRRYPNGTFADLARQRVSTAAEPKPAAGSRRFDGSWTIFVACDPTKDALGYTWTVPASIQDGVLHGQFGTVGQTPSGTFEGTIQPDGSAVLQVHGLTGNEDYSVKRVARGYPFSYHLKSSFDASHGSGTRIETRPCTASFAKN